jgi:phage terminase large subunit-like protein
MNYIKEYYHNITSKWIASERVVKQYKKLVHDIDNPGKWVYDEERANKPITFIERYCKHSKGEWMGKDVELDLFQKAFINALFGFVHYETGIRRYKEAFFLVARKNGKSTLLSGIMLYMLMADKEGGAQIVSAATKREQSSIVFNEALNMVKQSPDLSQNLKKRKIDLYFPFTFSTMTALSSDSNTLDGLNLHLAVIDELHAIKDRNLYEVLKQGMSARKQPLLVMITTAGTVRENIFDDMYEYACKVVDGTFEDERFLPIIYELDNKQEWMDPKAWYKANPGLNSIKKLEDIEEKVERAKLNAKDLPGILTKDFNIRETNAGAWLTFETINNEDTFNIDEISDSYAIGGVDLSSTTDLTCATIIVGKENGMKYVLQQYFMPKELIEQRTKEDKIPYDIWTDRGFLTLCEGNKVNYTQVTEWFVDNFQNYNIRPLWIGYDPWNSQYWVDEMKDTGFDMVVVRQGAQTLSQPMKEMAADLSANKINYNNNPILKWCLTNTSVKHDDNDNIRPVKGRNQKQRIDGAVSLLIAYTVLFEKYNDYKALI